MITIVFKVQLLRLAPTTLIIVLLNLSVFSLYWPSSLPRCRTLYLTLFKPHFCKTYKQGHILLIEAFGFSLSSYHLVPCFSFSSMLRCPYLLIILDQHLLLIDLYLLRIGSSLLLIGWYWPLNNWSLSCRPLLYMYNWLLLNSHGLVLTSDWLDQTSDCLPLPIFLVTAPINTRARCPADTR